MIEIQKAEEEFKKYTSNYDMTQRPIKRKVCHTFRVEDLSGKIAELLKMNKEQINLAKCIGLLHDIARFEQYTKYKTYDDLRSIDHGDYGVEILKKDDYIRKFIETDKYDKIILKSIKNHNKYSIEPNMSKEEEIFSKIIRDADKLDILHQAICESWKENMKDIEGQSISPKVLEQFLSKQVVDKQYIKYDIDTLIVRCAFIYDINVKDSYKIIKENNYINKMIDRFNFEKEETKTQMELVRKVADDYINAEIAK